MKHDFGGPIRALSYFALLPTSSQICRNVRNSRIRNRKQDNSDLRQLAGTEFTQPDRLSTADEFYRAPRRRQPPGSDIPYRHARVAQQFSERLA